MATTTTESGVVTKLKDITECSICLKTFTDPRMLPCIHTFCLKCLKDIGSNSQKKLGDGIPCPICRKEFKIPMEGFEKIKKNFFMESLMEMIKIATSAEKGAFCNICQVTKAKVSKSTMHCIDCRETFCTDCSKVHKAQTATRDHSIVEIGSITTAERIELKSLCKPLHCQKHPAKTLDYYCYNCPKVICVSCFVESHNSHKCTDVNQVFEGFSKSIKENIIDKIPTCLTLTLTKTEELKKKREEFLEELGKKEKEIQKRNKELKDMIDRHTKFLLEDLLTIKQRRLKEMETEKEELDMHLSNLESFNSYCKELTLKGSPGDICRSVDEIKRRGKEIVDESGTLSCRCIPCVKISFEKTDLQRILKNNENAVGRIKATEQENCFVVVGINDGVTPTKDVFKINLDNSNEVSDLEPIPTQMNKEAAAAVYNNTLFVTGIGKNKDEIWKYELISKWSRCTSLVKGRRRHCATFIQDDDLFISGGFVDSNKRVLSSVEAYSALTNRCTTVGRLIHPVHCAASAAYGNSIYVFGGKDKDNKDVDYVQVYNTLENNCSLLSKKMPHPYSLMRFILWEKSVILLGRWTCFIFNFETEIWKKRKQFKTEVNHFGSVLQNEKIFVVGGGIQETDKDGKTIWNYRDDVRYIPVMNIINNEPIEWQSFAKLPKSCLVQAYVGMTFPGESTK